MEQCSICLESLDGGVVALATCGHRFHAACLAQMAGAVGTATTRRGSLTACPNCRTVSRRAKKLRVDGAIQKKNGKWTNKDIFPCREFDSLDEYRAAKKQRAARREEYLARARENPRGCPR
jgi:hypothetical protein